MQKVAICIHLHQKYKKHAKATYDLKELPRDPHNHRFFLQILKQEKISNKSFNADLLHVFVKSKKGKKSQNIILI
ncbi:hypothetical protein BpHYR1_037131 [Brachionus plicatilis]|uniref:Uncharacterized protein n=1 Tax=Brachionus plicatilis TaxID=10195 RepID=A0A3M7SY97_BRAPC|nr:hypothetical protein BpHYR1_037131 [Brachionus plicatilis]